MGEFFAANVNQTQAANAISTMVAGLIGCGLGALAYRRGDSNSEGSALRWK